MLVILLTGVSGCGKDTIAKELFTLYAREGKKVQIVHNADPAKEMMKKYFGIDNYKNDLGKQLIMGLTDLIYTEANYYYFEKKSMQKVEHDTEVLIIPDWRYMNTFQWWQSYGLCNVVSVLIKRGIEFLPKYYSLDVTEKEGKLLKELCPDYAVNNKNAKATAQHLKDLFSNLED